MTFQRRFDVYSLTARTAAGSQATVSTPPSGSQGPSLPSSAAIGAVVGAYGSGGAGSAATAGAAASGSGGGGASASGSGSAPPSAERNRSSLPRVKFLDSLEGGDDDGEPPTPAVPTHRTSGSPNPIIRNIKRPADLQQQSGDEPVAVPVPDKRQRK